MGKDIGNKKLKKTNVKHLFHQHTVDYNDIQEKILEIKKEKLALQKEDLEFKKKSHQECTELMISLIGKIDELKNIVQTIAPIYLE